MYLSQYRSDDFYVESKADLWGDALDVPIKGDLSLNKLDRELAEGLATWWRMHPPPTDSGWSINKVFVGVVLAVGAASVAIGAAASAGGGASAAGVGAGAASGGASAAAGTASAATGGALSAGKALTMVAKGAEYLKKGAGAYTAVTGKETPAELMAAADIVENSDDWTEASEKAFQYYVEKTGNEDLDDKQKALLREQLKREQHGQAERIRELARKRAAENQRQATGGAMDYWPLLIPAGLVVVMGVL